MSLLRFDGRVAVVTGAGAVVVNDLGGGRHGEGKSSNAADAVVEEIRKKGGVAVANYDSVVEGEKIIQTALDNFGRIDIVVNNAGILRDKSFARISNSDWDLINDVHLKGAFKTTQAAWPHFRKQNYGRVIVTASNSGLYGNFGQANYSAAKMGLVGLNNTIAIEGKKNNIHCNVIVPTAASRLTEDILPPDFFAQLRPELIAPVVVWLCHESCEDTGAIIESAAGWAGKCHLVRSPGGALRTRIDEMVTVEAVKDAWSKVTDMSAAVRLETIQEASGELLNKSLVTKFHYTPRDLIIYALGVGSTVTNESDLRFLYEGHEDFSALPTYLVLQGVRTLMENSLTQEVLAGHDMLHGEQYLELLRPLATEGTLEVHCKVADVVDKGSGTIILVDVDTYDDSGEKVARSQVVTFAVGLKGVTTKRSSPHSIATENPPKRSPDASISQKTSLDQAALYRLSGDFNPLHIDPNVARFGGFERPILHGLCSLGFSARHVLQQFANNDPSKFRAIKVRFSKPVLPGQTLQTDMWQQGNRIHFQTSVKETGDVVISGAYVDLTEVSAQPAKTMPSQQELKSDEVFAMMKKRVDADPAKVKKINGVFLYKITKDGAPAGSWTVDLKQAKVYKGDPTSGKADCTLTLSDDDMVQIATGKLNPQRAFIQGKLKVAGNIMLTQKLSALIREESKL
ncbi:Peroxisomal multifunctional enzyme type 2 [Blattella germanica]|nr:Peroxisomal multifunctional enzyme type 2 [Blattella germanica]